MSSRGVNKAIIVGNLGGDPETRYTQSNSAVTNISVATSESWKDKQTGEKKERSEWHKIVFFGKLAEIAGEYLRKGAKVYVEGSIRTRKWQDKEGQDRYTTEIVGDQMQMLDSRVDQSQEARKPVQQHQQAPASDPYDDSDIPFSGAAMKHNTHQNSRDAYTAIAETLPACRRRVYETIVRGGRLTRQEVSDVSGMPINTVCGRVKELLEAGLVREDSSVVVDNHRRALLTVDE